MHKHHESVHTNAGEGLTGLQTCAHLICGPVKLNVTQLPGYLCNTIRACLASLVYQPTTMHPRCDKPHVLMGNCMGYVAVHMISSADATADTLSAVADALQLPRDTPPPAAARLSCCYWYAASCLHDCPLLDETLQDATTAGCMNKTITSSGLKPDPRPLAQPVCPKLARCAKTAM
ncbi:hypothetical protein COO60DRAFT_290940 [Scenedesmus sp. NREL 46B-D3]|nr:hypothetical protein COO60DRAFT_290940 [Scenedesmus sp. NREL 46B-D3]